MKKLIFCLLLPLCSLTVCLCACGGCYNMNGWPTIDLNLDVESYDEVSLEFNILPSKQNKDEFHYYGSSTEKDVIKEIYETINCFHYSEKTYDSINTEEYWENVIIKFTKDSEEYVFKFYSYAIYDGYFIFNNGEIHKYHGDFVSASYEHFKDKLA